MQEQEEAFKSLITYRLDELVKGQETMMKEQRHLHDLKAAQLDGIIQSMAKHALDDNTAFAAVNARIATFEPVKQVVIGMVSLILIGAGSSLVYILFPLLLKGKG